MTLGGKLLFGVYRMKTGFSRQIYTGVMRTLMKEQKQFTHQSKTRSTLYYLSGVGVFVVGLTYAAVPLYRVFCQAYGYGGTVTLGHDSEKVVDMKAIRNKEIKVKFTADTASEMRWNFRPHQREIKLVPGETALAFYTATNPTDVPVTGVSTYNVVPYEAAPYFNKIQCFCFEEQQLNPHEEVDMPVFFYIDPEFAEDPKMEFVSDITLSYTFFEAKEGMKLPIPSYIQKHIQGQKKPAIA